MLRARNSVRNFLIHPDHRIFISKKWSVISGFATGFGIEVKIGEILVLIPYDRAVCVSKVDMSNIQSSLFQCAIRVSEGNSPEGAVNLKEYEPMVKNGSGHLLENNLSLGKILRLGKNLGMDKIRGSKQFWAWWKFWALKKILRLEKNLRMDKIRGSK